MSSNSSMRREHPGWTDDATGAGQLAVVQYNPFHHAEITLLQTLSKALPWSAAVATALREALAHGGFPHRSTPSTATEGGNVQRKVKGGNRRQGMLSDSRDGEGGVRSISDSGGGSEATTQNGCGTNEHALGVHAIQLALATLGGVPGHLAGGAEGRCAAAAFALSVAMATTVEGRLPPQLLRVVSPHRASLEQLRPLGKGGFGSVVAVRSRLDHRVMALKTVAFRSKLPPWAPFEQLEREHAKLLREVQTLAGLEGSPHVVRYYNAWIEPAWEKLGQQLQERGRGREARQAQARTARKTKAAPPAATGYRPHASAAAGAAPAQGANLSVARAAKMAAAPSLVHTSNRVGPQIERMESDFSGGTDPQPCRIRELRGSRSSNNSSPSGNSAVSDGSTDTKSDRDSGRGFGMRSLGRDRLRRGFQHHVARTTAPQRPLPRIEPLVDLPTSPDITSPFPPWAVSGADAIADAVVTSRQPFVTMPPSSSEPSRRRSLDSIWATSRRSTSSGDDGGSANGDVAAAAALLVSVPGTPEDESSLGRRWRGAHVTMNRSPTPHAWSSQPRITSLSTSPEGLFGALLAPVSLSSSSIESIRVPPGGRIAASLAGGGSGRGGHDDTSAARVAYFSYINTPEQALSSRGDGEGNRIVRGPVVASGTSRRAWDEGHTRTAMQAEQYARTFDRGHILAPRTRQDASKSDASDTTHFSSTTATRTATLTGAPVHGGGGDIVNYGSEEFSWTFDRGDERAEDNIADGSLRPGPGSPTNGTGEMGGGGRNGGALPCTAMERGDVRVRTRYEDNDSSESEGRRGRGRGGVLERRSRKGRRGKGGHPAGDVAARTQGIGDRKGAIVHLSEAAGVLMFRTHLNGCNTSESISFSGGGSDSDGSDSNSSSSSGMGSESSSGSGKLSEEGKREEEEGEDDSESSGSWNEYGLPELRAQPPSKYNRFHKHREYFERNHGAGTIIRPSQLPLPAPRHQRRRSVQRSEVSNTDREAIGENRRCRQRERPRRKRGNQERIQVVEEGIQVDGTDCTAHGGIRGSMPAATAWDRTVLSGIREWPYRLYISMELVRGPTLTLWLQQRTERLLNGSSSLGYRAPDHPPDPPTVERSIFRQIVTGLCHVHASGIIHRDLKPANIFLVPFEKASVAAGAGSWDGVGARSTMGSGTTVLPASARADVDFYLVKIGDFGLAVDHELPQDLVDNPREAFSLSTSTSTSSAAPLDGPLGSAATIATAAVGHGAQLHRPLSVPLLSDAPLASGGSGEGILPTAEGSGLDMPRWNSSSTSAHTSGVGTASYSAPEQLRDHLSGVSFYGPAVDIYPLGLILMELFCLHGTAMERANAMRDARQGRLPTSFLRSYPLEARLAEACLQTVPELRPSASQILELLDAMWGSQIGTGTGPGAWTGGTSVGAGSSGSSRCSDVDAAPGQGRGSFVAPGNDAVANEGQNKELGFIFGKPSRVAGCLLGEDAPAAPSVAANALRAMQRTSSGPLPRNNRTLQRPLLPPRPCPPFHGPNVTGPVIQLPYDEGRPTFVIGSGRFSTAVAAVLEDVGTQTELTWVPWHQLMPRALDGAERLDVANVALQPRVHVTLHEDSATIPDFTSATTATAGAHPAIRNAAMVPTARCGAVADVDDKVVLLARLQSLEAEVQRLREVLADMQAA